MDNYSNKNDRQIQEEILDTLKKILGGQELNEDEQEEKSKNRKKKHNEKLTKEHGFKGTKGTEKDLEKGIKNSFNKANKAYAIFKKGIIVKSQRTFGTFGKLAAKTAISATEIAAEAAFKTVVNLNKNAAKIAIATTKKAIEKSSELTQKEIETTNKAIRKSIDIATSSMKDPIDGLGMSIDTIGSSLDDLGSNFGAIGKAIGGTFGNIMSQFNKFETEALKNFSEIDDAAHKMQKAFGLNQSQTQDYLNSSIQAAKMVATKWGKTYEDMMKAQKNIVDTSGRNILYGEEDYNQFFGLSQVAGEENALGLTAGLQDFNQDVSSVNDMYLEMYKNAQKVGVSIEKSTKDVLNNLKLANKYNFKEGSKSIMEMAVWANKTKFNLSSISNIIDKVSGEGVESAITSSAQLQVLGGDFANQSNPLGMLYETLEDPQALAERVQKMTSNMGKFDVKTGETKLTGNDMRMLQAASKALGISSEEMNVMAKESIRRKEVEKQISEGSGLSEEQKTLISSKAQWDKEAQQFYVTDLEGNKTYTNEINTSNIGNFDLSEELSNEEKMVDYAEKTFSQVDEIAKVVAGKSIKDAELGKQQQKLMGESITTTKDVMNVIYDSIDSVVGEFNTAMSDNLSEFVPLIKQITDSIMPLVPQITELFKPILSILSETIIPLFDSIKEPMINLANTVIPAIGEITKAISPIVETFMTALSPIIESLTNIIVPLLEQITPLVQNIINSVAPIITKILDSLQPLIEGVLPVLNSILEQFYPIIDTLLSALIPIANTIIDNILPFLKGFFEVMGPSINRTLGIIGEVIGKLFETFSPAIGRIIESIGKIASVILDVVTPILGSIIDLLTPFIGVVLNILTPIIQVIANGLKTLSDIISPLLRGIYNILNFSVEVFNKMWGIAQEISDNIIGFLDKVTNFISTPLKNMANWFDRFTDDFHINDGIITNNGIVQTNSKDTIIAAKTGGPFDTLFNDMYNKISEVYDKTDERNNLNKTIVDDNKNINRSSIVKVEPIGSNNNDVSISNDKINIKNNNSYNNGNIAIPPINVNINGKLDLSSNGQNINIIELLRTNPLFVRELTDMVLKQVGANMNGGRTTLFNESLR